MLRLIAKLGAEYRESYRQKGERERPGEARAPKETNRPKKSGLRSLQGLMNQARTMHGEDLHPYSDVPHGQLILYGFT